MTGARAGQVLHLDKPVIVIGRQKDADIRFDPQKDIDVSGRHAEIRLLNGQWAVADLGSTNGTFVNGERVEGARELKTGDRVQFGGSGPEVDIRVHRGRPNTEERVAIAVRKQTAGLRNLMIAASVVVVVAAGAGWYFIDRSSAARTEALSRALRRSDSLSAMLQGMSAADPALVEEVQRTIQGLRAAMASASSPAVRDSLRREIDANDARLRRIVQMDPSSIHRQNAPAVAVLVSEIGGVAFAGTGFSISSDGLIMTNRHNVLTGSDTASRIAVKFVNTREWLPASVVKISDHPDEDLALIRVDTEGTYPVVQGISSGTDAVEGASVVTIGFPLGYETPQQGEGNDFEAKSTLNAGTVSKRTSSVLQIDSYAAHGSSGSPVFNRLGHVVGVIYGGHREAGGRIVYAVPPDRIAAFVPKDRREIVKD